MSVGGALAKARGQAGLTVSQVSQRTRIRETIIRDIERDEFGTCGGDFYARGHIRAIAKVIQTDPVPLIEEYDAAHVPPDQLIRGTWTTPDGQPDIDLTGGSGGRANPGATQGSPQPGAGPPRPTGITAAEAFRPSMPLRARRKLPNWSVLLAMLLLLVIALLTYLLISGSPHSSGSSAPAASHSPRSAASRPTARPSPAGSAPARAGPATAAAAVPLLPASAAAFGPGGTSQGDDPQDAPLALDASASTAWHTDWYATAALGNLQSGTGLLLDMGKQVVVSRVRITLGAAPGADIQLRAGDVPSLASLLPIAVSTGSGGTVTLQPAQPTPARYLLLWFTRLPPDTSGTYQAYVYDVRVAGSP